MLGAHTETAPWLQRIHPWSSLASRWGQLAYEVGKADTDLKVRTFQSLDSCASSEN